MDVVGGYYQSWKVYSTCKITDINPTLCTILYYAFAGIAEDGSIKILDHWADVDLGGYQKFCELKKQNPKLKTLLSIGGWNEGSTTFSTVVSSPTARKSFIDSSLAFMQKYGFDGIDIDWEYPAQRGGKPEDKANFVQLLQEVRQSFGGKYLLTVAVGAGEWTVDTSYDVPGISKNVDYINVMTYDMHSYTDQKTGANAPLYSNDHLNVQYCIKYWLSHGANPKKLILGLGSYGKSYTLANSENNGIGAPTTGPGNAGPLTQSAGILSYTEIEAYLKQGWTKHWSHEQQIPYAYHGNQWVGYDDVESVIKKLEFGKQMNLSGVMMWAIDMDDPHGEDGKKYPLLNAINNR